METRQSPEVPCSLVWLDSDHKQVRYARGEMVTVVTVYGDWDDEHAQKRAKRAGVDLATLQRVLILQRSTMGNGYLVRGHVARTQHGTFCGFTRRRDGKMQMSQSGSPSGYTFGRDVFVPPDDTA